LQLAREDSEGASARSPPCLAAWTRRLPSRAATLPARFDSLIV